MTLVIVNISLYINLLRISIVLWGIFSVSVCVWLLLLWKTNIHHFTFASSPDLKLNIRVFLRLRQI